jgi:chromosome segregation ATPase
MSSELDNVEDLQKQIKHYSSLVDKIQKELSASQSKLSGVTKLNNGLAEQSTFLQQLIKEKDVVLQEKQTELSRTINMCESLTTENNHLYSKITELEDEIHSKKKVEDNEKFIDDLLDRAVTSLRNEYEERIANQESLYHELKLEYNNCITRCKELEMDNNILNQHQCISNIPSASTNPINEESLSPHDSIVTVNHFEVLLKESYEREHKFENDIKSLQMQLASVTSQLAVASNRVSEFEENNHKQNLHIHKLENDLSILTESNKNTVKDLVTYRVQCSTMTPQVNALRVYLSHTLSQLLSHYTFANEYDFQLSLSKYKDNIAILNNSWEIVSEIITMYGNDEIRVKDVLLQLGEDSVDADWVEEVNLLDEYHTMDIIQNKMLLFEQKNKVIEELCFVIEQLNDELTQPHNKYKDMYSLAQITIEDLKIQHRDHINELNACHENIINNMQNEFESKMSDIVSQYETRINLEHQSHEQSLRSLLDTYTTNWQSDHQSATEALLVKYESQINNLNSEHQSDISKYESQISALQSEHESGISKCETQINDLKSEHQSATEVLQSKYESQISDLQSENQSNISKYESQISNLHLQHQSDISKYESQISALQSDHQSGTDALLSKYESQISNLHSEHQSDISKYESQINDLKSEYRSATEVLQSKYESQISDLQFELRNNMKHIKVIEDEIHTLKSILEEIYMALRSAFSFHSTSSSNNICHEISQLCKYVIETFNAKLVYIEKLERKYKKLNDLHVMEENKMSLLEEQHMLLENDFRILKQTSSKIQDALKLDKIALTEQLKVIIFDCK